MRGPYRDTINELLLSRVGSPDGSESTAIKGKLQAAFTGRQRSRLMRRLLLTLILSAVSAPLLASPEVPFGATRESFAGPEACRAHLVAVVADARARGDAAAEGPYQVAPSDVRAHAVIISGSGHRITEHRCLAEKLSSRTWRHSMGNAEAEEAETIESMAAKAEWLKKPRGEQ